MLSRRDMLLGSGAAAVYLGTAPTLFGATNSDATFVTGYRDRIDGKNQYGLSLLSANGGLIADTPLPERIHALTLSPHQAYPHICAPARRPGYHLYIFQKKDAALLTVIDCPKGYHFQGHAAYHPHKPLLYTAENQYDQGKGVIGVWDVSQNYKRVATLPSGGIGPHEIKIHPNQKSLVIANGGLLTHPDFGRDVLNLEDMAPNLSFLGLDNHQIEAQYALPDEWHQNSIRHFDINSHGQILIGLQYQGGRHDQVPLVAIYQPDNQTNSELIPLTAPLPVQKRMRQYCGSVIFLSDQAIACISHPRGNFTTFWDMSKLSYLNMIKAPDICGLAPTVTGLMATTGTGHIVTLADIQSVSNLQKPSLKPYPKGRSWDNHLTALLP